MSINVGSAVNKKHGRDEDNDITSDTTTTNTATAITAAGCNNNNNNNNNNLPLPALPLLTHSLSSSYEYLSYQIEQMQQNALQRRLLDMSTAIIGDNINIDPNTIKVLWKDFVFLLLGCIALSIIGYVETNSTSAIQPSVETTTTTTTRTTTNDSNNSNPNGIIDTGFILTQPLYTFLLNNRYWNDIFAGLNSIVLLIPGLYIGYMTLWIGDYSCSFRVLSVSLLRAFCGWFTYLPPDPSYLNSYYDFPDVIHCITGNEDCSPTSNSDSNSESSSPAIMPFVSFFSGHVATLVVVANHMALSKTKSTRYYWSVTIHVLNILQIIRLLATRGHYSIDIIIGWYVAVYVSNPAGRLGRYYSRGHTLGDILIPKTPIEAYERVIGISELKKERRMSALLKRPEVQEAIRTIERQEVAAAENSNNTSTSSSSGVSSDHNNIGIGIGISIGIDDDDDVQSDTTARILQEAASKIMQEQAIFLQEEIRFLQQQYQANKQHYYKSNNDIKRTAISQQQQREVGNDDDTIKQKKEK